MYNCGVMSILGGLLSIILHENYYKESYGITAICIIFPSLGTLFLIFLPKVSLVNSVSIITIHTLINC